MFTDCKMGVMLLNPYPVSQNHTRKTNAYTHRQLLSAYHAMADTALYVKSIIQPKIIFYSPSCHYK